MKDEQTKTSPQVKPATLETIHASKGMTRAEVEAQMRRNGAMDVSINPHPHDALEPGQRSLDEDYDDWLERQDD